MLEDTRKGKFPRDDELLKILYQQNPWWQKKPIPEIKLKDFKRLDYFKLIKNLDDEKILGIIGARQVGKTTMLYQLIEKLQKDNDPKNIFFLSLDDPYLIISQENLSRIFDLYSTNVVKRPFNELTERIYVIFDEIQVLKNWQEILKRWIDLGYKIKFIISGSSSTDILKGTSESLVGRIKSQIVMPMKFFEYVRYFDHDENADLLHDSNLTMRKGLKNSLYDGDSAQFYDSIIRCINDLAPIKDKLLTYLSQYLIQGGYPEIMTLDNSYAKAERLQNYLHLTIYKDIMHTGKVRDPSSLESLFAILSKESSQIISRQNISKNLGIARDTLNTYLFLLEEAFLISNSEVYSPSRVVRGRSGKKMYVNDIGIRNVISATFDDQILTDYTELGKMVETTMADHSKRLKLSLDPSSKPELFYWRGPNEVDIVIELFQKVLPIEVKYRQSITSSDYKGIKNFNDRFNPDLSLVITKDHLDKKDTIVFIPGWLYLLMC